VKENSDGNDTNVGSIGNSIEEDIKILESIIKINNDYLKGIENQTINQKEIKAIEHILSDYKRTLKENERYKKSDYETICLENNELREITDRIQSEYNDLLKDNFKLKNELETKRKEYQETYKDVREELKELRKENEELKNKLNLKQFDVNIVYNDYLEKLDEYERNTIPIQRIKDIIDRIDYDIKKTKEIISKNTNIYASYRKNDYQIVRLKAMNTKSLDIKKRLQELLDGSDADVGSIESEE
jgi:chromosome segregation ATPase